MKRKKKIRRGIKSLENIHYHENLVDYYDNFLHISFDDEEILPQREQLKQSI